MYKRLLVTVLVSVFVFSLWGKTETVCQSLEVEDSVPVFQKDTLFSNFSANLHLFLRF